MSMQVGYTYAGNVHSVEYTLYHPNIGTSDRAAGVMARVSFSRSAEGGL